MEIIGKTIKEQLEEIERKIKILVANNLIGTTPYCMLVNSKMLLQDQLANQLIRESVDSVEEVSK